MLASSSPLEPIPQIPTTYSCTPTPYHPESPTSKPPHQLPPGGFLCSVVVTVPWADHIILFISTDGMLYESETSYYRRRMSALSFNYVPWSERCLSEFTQFSL